MKSEGLVQFSQEPTAEANEPTHIVCYVPSSSVCGIM